MAHITDRDLSEALDRMHTVFSSHEFIRDLMKHCPEQYIHDLLALFKRGVKRPLTSLHASIGKRITKFEKKQKRIERLERKSSRNILGRSVSNQRWRRTGK